MSAVKAASVAIPLARTRPRMSANRRRELRWGFFFLMPWFIGLIGFQLLPIVMTIFLSFTNYAGTTEFAPGNFDFVGLDNYARLFRDIDAIPSMLVTLKFALIGIPLGLIIPLFFAVLVNSRHLIGSNLFRTLFFMPTIIPVVAATMIYRGTLNANTGWMNLFLEWLGIVDPPRWFTDPFWAVPALNLLGIWGVGNAMLILLASLQGVPTELYESATVDGANAVTKFWNITLPMISPVIFYNVTLGVIGSIQYFVPAMLIGGLQGDPQKSLIFFGLYFYREGFSFSEMGYASVLALVMFGFSMLATAALFFFAQRNVYYAGGE